MAWIENGLEPMPISVNISAMQFYQTGFCGMVRSIISESGMDPIYLELELTESLFMHDVEVVLKTLHILHGLGVKLSIDDFGTGYSNLGYLKLFPIDKLKIDQSFVRNLENEPVNLDIVRAIAALGKSMSLELVAEGVETNSELDLVQATGCDLVQGYHFSKPLPANEIELWMKERNLNTRLLLESLGKTLFDNVKIAKSTNSLPERIVSAPMLGFLESVTLELSSVYKHAR
jgi:EAL domain-containing protein (putative c-di-GMP-specific phosphodiesterase class I)